MTYPYNLFVVFDEYPGESFWARWRQLETAGLQTLGDPEEPEISADGGPGCSSPPAGACAAAASPPGSGRAGWGARQPSELRAGGLPGGGEVRR